MRFFKYQGLGNDFVLLDRREDPEEATADLARRVCDRRLGVGADGLVVLLPPRRGGDVRMSFRNADGSTAEMCGNGIRCLALHAWDADREKRQWVVETDSGLRRCVVFGSRGFEGVDAEMGPAAIDGGLDEEMDLEGARLRITRVKTGNPHAVTFDPVAPDARATLGPAIETHPLFPDRTNVEFVETRGPRHLVVTVWERGVGFTRACGTGACAVAAAACHTGRAPFDTPIRVTLPGGDLEITVPRDLTNLRMRGPAERVFEGEIPP